MQPSPDTLNILTLSSFVISCFSNMGSFLVFTREPIVFKSWYEG